jgi:flavin-dependent dehydrogenase
MRIAIAGAGISGAYMYRLLKNNGFDVTIFDLEHKTNCGINPCAWGTTKGFQELVEKAGLNPNDYILRLFDHIWFDEIKIKAYMLTIDKPKLIKDLLGDAEIKKYEPSERLRFNYDRVIDATGVARAFLPKIPNDLISPCYQYRMTSDELLPEMRIKVSKIGYAWSFPLSDTEFHIGAGSLVTDPIKILKDINWIQPYSSGQGVKCACYSKVRQTAPRGSRPFVHENVWGIGEAIGCVAPMLGDGIIHGMRSALFQLENLYSAVDYERAILREFAWMEKEREVVERFIRGKPIGLGSALVLQRNTRRMDMKIGLWDAFRLLRRARI